MDVPVQVASAMRPNAGTPQSRKMSLTSKIGAINGGLDAIYSASNSSASQASSTAKQTSIEYELTKSEIIQTLGSEYVSVPQS